MNPRVSILKACQQLMDKGATMDGPWRTRQMRRAARRPFEILISPLLCGPEDAKARTGLGLVQASERSATSARKSIAPAARRAERNVMAKREMAQDRPTYVDSQVLSLLEKEPQGKIAISNELGARIGASPEEVRQSLDRLMTADQIEFTSATPTAASKVRLKPGNVVQLPGPPEPTTVERIREAVLAKLVEEPCLWDDLVLWIRKTYSVTIGLAEEMAEGLKLEESIVVGEDQIVRPATPRATRAVLERDPEAIKTAVLLTLANGPQAGSVIVAEVSSRFESVSDSALSQEQDQQLVDDALEALLDAKSVRFADKEQDLLELNPDASQPAEGTPADSGSAPEAAKEEAGAQQEPQGQAGPELPQLPEGVDPNMVKLLAWLGQMKSRTPGQCGAWAKKELGLAPPATQLLLDQALQEGWIEKHGKKQLRIKAHDLPAPPPQESDPQQPQASAAAVEPSPETPPNVVPLPTALTLTEVEELKQLRELAQSQQIAQEKERDIIELEAKISQAKEDMRGLREDIKSWEARIDALREELTPWAYGRKLLRAGQPPVQQPLPLRDEPRDQPAEPKPAQANETVPEHVSLEGVQKLKALSLHQPWASDIAAAAVDRARGKTIETRGWTTSHRGLLAIHAAKQLKDEQRDACREEPHKTALELVGVGIETMPLGSIVAVAILESVVPTVSVGEISDVEVRFGNYGPDRFAWRLSEIVRLETPVPCKGAQGIFDVPAEVLEQLRQQLVKPADQPAPEQAAVEPAPAEATVQPESTEPVAESSEAAAAPSQEVQSTPEPELEASKADLELWLLEQVKDGPVPKASLDIDCAAAFSHLDEEAVNKVFVGMVGQGLLAECGEQRDSLGFGQNGAAALAERMNQPAAATA